MNKQIAVFVMILVLGSGPGHSRLAEVTIIGGHFWVLESELKKVRGVLQTVAGYYYKTASNDAKYPANRTQAVRIVYNPEILSLARLASTLSQEGFQEALALRFCQKDASRTTAILTKNNIHYGSKASLTKTNEGFFESIIKPLQGYFLAAHERDQDFINEHPIQFWWYSLQCKTKLFFGRHVSP